MGIGVGIFLLAIGAILAFAVDATVAGVDLDVVGVILMIAGAVGLLWGLLATSSMGRSRRDVYEVRDADRIRR